MNYLMLEKVICDTIKEEQIKLGYEKETIRLYYPMNSLSHLLEEEITDVDHMIMVLKQFSDYTQDKLGRIRITHQKERFCLIIPPEGAAYVHSNYEDNPFLRELIETIRKHNCTLEELLAVFHHYSGQVVCEKSGTEEFDYVIYFTDSTLDDYRYCIKFDHGHAIYHRFSKKDYEML